MFQKNVVQKIKTQTQNEKCFRQKLYRRSKHTIRMRNVSDKSCTQDQNTHSEWEMFQKKSCTEDQNTHSEWEMFQTEVVQKIKTHF